MQDRSQERYGKNCFCVFTDEGKGATVSSQTVTTNGQNIWTLKMSGRQSLWRGMSASHFLPKTVWRLHIQSYWVFVDRSVVQLSYMVWIIPLGSTAAIQSTHFGHPSFSAVFDSWARETYTGLHLVPCHAIKCQRNLKTLHAELKLTPQKQLDRQEKNSSSGTFFTKHSVERKERGFAFPPNRVFYGEISYLDIYFHRVGFRLEELARKLFKSF